MRSDFRFSIRRIFHNNNLRFNKKSRTNIIWFPFAQIVNVNHREIIIIQCSNNVNKQTKKSHIKQNDIFPFFQVIFINNDDDDNDG